YGYRDDDAELELVNMRVSVWGPSPALALQAAGATAPVAQTGTVVFDGRPTASAILRGELPPGTRVTGPALCALPDATLLVPPGWSGEVDEQGTIRLAVAR
ncbi:MAG: hydantoinase/oxoprolinase family protein, partial [Solirubrobacteraceae bacterium]